MNLIILILSNFNKATVGNFHFLSHAIKTFFLYIYPLPSFVFDINEAEKLKSTNKPFELKVDKKLVIGYENAINELKLKIKELDEAGNKNTLDFNYKFILMFFFRVIFCYVAYTQSFYNLGLFLFFQALIYPYYISVSIMHCFTYYSATFIGSIISFIIIHCFYSFLMYLSNEFYFLNFLTYLELINFSVTISYNTIVIYLIVDHILSFIALYWNPFLNIPVKKVGAKRIITTILYELFNGKVTVVSVLLFMNGSSFNLLYFAIDFYFDIPKYYWKQIASYWNTFIYHQHRYAHLPEVYFDGHKFHHYIDDTTPFAGNGFGSGGIEETILSVSSILFSSLIGRGLFAPFLPSVILVDLFNKMNAHVRFEDEYNQYNFHADHHKHPTKNYAYGPIEILFNTCIQKNKMLDDGDYEVNRTEDKDFIYLKYSKISNPLNLGSLISQFVS